MRRTERIQTRSGTLQYELSGRGRPAIVLVAGAGVPLVGWEPLHPAIESLGTVVAWNRFGVEGSGEAVHAPTGVRIVAALREMLAHAGVEPPFLLVAHSFGGLYANLFARLHPCEVAGVVFVESLHPHDPLPQDPGKIASALANVLHLPRVSFEANLRAEVDAAQLVVEEIESAPPFPPVPLRVITGAARPPRWAADDRAVLARRAHQETLARLSPHGRQVIAARSGHFPQSTEPEMVLDVVGELAGMLQRA